MEYINKLRIPNSFKVIEFNYPKNTNDINDTIDTNSINTETTNSINTKYSNMTGGTISSIDTTSNINLPSYKKFDKYFKQYQD